MASIINVNEVGPAAGFSTVTVNSDLTTNTLKLDTIKNKTGENASTPDEIYSGRAKAWVNFNGTTGSGNNDVTIRASFNVSSINDDATGKYTINFTTNLPSENYVVAGATNANNPGEAQDLILEASSYTRVASSALIATSAGTTGSTVLYDGQTVNVVFFA